MSPVPWGSRRAQLGREPREICAPPGEPHEPQQVMPHVPHIYYQVMPHVPGQVMPQVLLEVRGWEQEQTQH